MLKMIRNNLNDIKAVPKYGLKLKCNYVYPEKRVPSSVFPPFLEFIKIIPIILR